MKQQMLEKFSFHLILVQKQFLLLVLPLFQELYLQLDTIIQGYLQQLIMTMTMSMKKSKEQMHCNDPICLKMEINSVLSNSG